MKKVFNYIFGKWNSFDYSVLALTIILVSIVCLTIGYSALSAIVAVFLVLGTIMIAKNGVLGYAVELVALGLFCAVLKADNLYGNLIATAAIIMPLLVYKIVSYYVKKLNDTVPMKNYEYAILLGVIALAAYPIYLLMISLNSFMAAVEVISLLIALVLAFLEIRGYKWANNIYIIFSILQFVLYILIMYFNDTREINILIGLAFSVLLQIYYFSQWLTALLKERKLAKKDRANPAQNN